jgi:hypothetical protein
MGGMMEPVVSSMRPPAWAAIVSGPIVLATIVLVDASAY